MLKLFKNLLFLIPFLVTNLYSLSMTSVEALQLIDQYRSIPFPSNFKRADAIFLDSSFLKMNNKIYTYSVQLESVFNASLGINDGFFLYSENFLIYRDPSFETVSANCSFDGDRINYCSPYNDNPRARPMDFSYYQQLSIQEFATCHPNENFNTETKKCEPPCPAGQSWDQGNNMCWSDCTDVNNNKWGIANGTSQGSCIDCSNEKTLNGVAQCFCTAFDGSSFASGGVSIFDPKGGGFYGSVCDSGTTFQLKDPTTPDVPENNQTDPNTNPNPDPNPNPNDNPISGDSGNSGSEGGNTGSQTTPKPDSNTSAPSTPVGPVTGGDSNKTIINNGGGDNGDEKEKWGGFDYSDLKDTSNKFTSDYKSAIDKILDGFENFNNGVSQFIDNVTGKGLNPISKKGIPKTCSHKYTIDFYGHPAVIDFDFCKVIAPASDAFYYLFYVFFFFGFLMLVVKLLIFSF